MLVQSITSSGKEEKAKTITKLNYSLLYNGVNLGNLSDSQFTGFQAQHPIII